MCSLTPKRLDEFEAQLWKLDKLRAEYVHQLAEREHELQNSRN
jgi:hypothetical protein